MTSSSSTQKFLQRMNGWFDDWLFGSCSPYTCVLLRIGYAILLILYTAVWMKDGVMWFSDEGVMTAQTAQRVLAGEQQSLFYWLPASPSLILAGLSCLLLNAILLLLGVYPRVQAACIFVWLVSFQHRNPLILDGEDTVFRLFAFFLMLMPLDYAWAVTGRAKRLRSAAESGPDFSAAWALRFVQIEMCLIYVSAAWSKALGTSWQDGTALYYVYQMQDLFGRNPLPAWVTAEPSVIRFSTWSVLLVEAALPFALLFRPTRKLALVIGIGLHLTMEYAMHLHLFQWVMILGLLSFVQLGERPGASTPTEVPAEEEDAQPREQQHPTPLPA